MTPPDERIRESLRDLIPGYQGPLDPYLRVGAVIRRRRSRQRVLIAISSMAAVAAVLLVAPLVIRGRGPATPGGLAGLGPTASGPAGRSRVERAAVPAPVQAGAPVASGAVAAGHWAVHAVQLSSGAHRCLHADDAVFAAAALCFDDWPTGGAVSWGTVDAVRSGVPVSAVFGVAAANVGWVLVVLSDGSERQVRAVASADLPDTRFFAVVARGRGLTVGTVATMTADGDLAQFPTATSGSPACRPSPTEPCTRPSG